MMNKKKLAIFINTLVRAGAEKVVASLILEFQNEYEIHLLMFNTTEIEFPIPSGVTIKQIGKPKSGEAGLIDIIKMPLLALTIKKYLQKNQIPVLLSFLNRPNFITGLVKLLGWNGKSIMSERTMTSTYYSNTTFGGKLGRFLVRKLYKNANIIITNSKLCEEDLRKTFLLTNEIVTINNPINLKEVAVNKKSINEHLFKKNGEFLFCNIGRHNHFKNQELLLSAFSKMNDETSKLVIVGREVPSGLSNRVKELNLDERILLIGMQHNIFPYLLESDCFVLTSRLEGFPNVIIEALACDLPVIATDCKSGPREILAPNKSFPQKWEHVEVAEYGILTENENVKMLTEALLLIRNNELLRKQYTLKASNRVLEFDNAIIIQKFRNVILQQYN